MPVGKRQARPRGFQKRKTLPPTPALSAAAGLSPDPHARGKGGGQPNPQLCRTSAKPLRCHPPRPPPHPPTGSPACPGPQQTPAKSLIHNVRNAEPHTSPPQIPGTGARGAGGGGGVAACNPSQACFPCSSVVNPPKSTPGGRSRQLPPKQKGERGPAAHSFPKSPCLAQPRPGLQGPGAGSEAPAHCGCLGAVRPLPAHSAVYLYGERRSSVNTSHTARSLAESRLQRTAAEPRWSPILFFF